MKYLVFASLLSAAAGFMDQIYWVMEAANDRRSSSIRASTTQMEGPSSVSYQKLGSHTYNQFDGVVSSTPVFTSDGQHILVSDDELNLEIYMNPEYLAGRLRFMSEFPTNKSGNGFNNLYCSTAAGSTNNRVTWINERSNQLFGVTVSSAGVATSLPWSPLHLPSATGGKHFKTWTQESAHLFHDNFVWIPSDDSHGAITVNASDGTSHYTDFEKESDVRLLGSVASTASNQHSVAFLSTGENMQSFTKEAKPLWNSSNVKINPPDNDFWHPVLLEAKDNTACIVFAKATNGHVVLYGVAPKSGHACWNWSTEGYVISSIYTIGATWVSSPAVIDLYEKTAFDLVFTINLPGTGTVQRTAVLSIQVTQDGIVPDSYDGHILEGHGHTHMAPAVLLGGRGSADRHAVYVILANGSLWIFASSRIHDGHIVHFSNEQVHPWDLSNKFVAAGNYMALSRGGTVAFAAYNSETKVEYLVTITRAMQGPPAVAPAKSNKAGTGAAVFFGLLLSLIFVGAVIYYVFPTWSFVLFGSTIVPATIVGTIATKFWEGCVWVYTKIHDLITGTTSVSTVGASSGEKSSLLKTAPISSSSFSGTSTSGSAGPIATNAFSETL